MQDWGLKNQKFGFQDAYKIDIEHTKKSKQLLENAYEAVGIGQKIEELV